MKQSSATSLSELMAEIDCFEQKVEALVKGR